MSGETILIERLRADVEKLRDDRADLQERCNRLSAEKSEALRMLADAEDLANEANAIQTTDALRAAESEIDALRRQLASRTEAIQTSLATTRELRERAEKAERERDDARADFRAVAEALGVMHEPCTGPSWPGTRDEVADVAARLREEADTLRAERDDARSAHGQSYIRMRLERDNARAEVAAYKATATQYDDVRSNMLLIAEALGVPNNMPDIIGAISASDILIDAAHSETADALSRIAFLEREVEKLRAALADATREFGCDNCGSHMPAMSSVERGSERWCCRCAADAELITENEKLSAARLKPETVEIVRRALDFYYGKSVELPPAFRGGDYGEVPVALADLANCYPEEE